MVLTTPENLTKCHPYNNVYYFTHIENDGINGHKFTPNDRVHEIAFIPNDGVYSRAGGKEGGVRFQRVGCGWYEDHRSSSAVMGKSLDCFILEFSKIRLLMWC